MPYIYMKALENMLAAAADGISASLNRREMRSPSEAEGS